ncbi:MAG: hypothetical protein R3F65_26065 [bacterium]|nr:hypothetical protein [Myxococcales bacterium]
MPPPPAAPHPAPIAPELRPIRVDPPRDRLAAEARRPARRGHFGGEAAGGRE